MILADIIQVVGHRALDIALGVVLEELQQHNHGARIRLEAAQSRCPGQPRPSSFRHEPPHMDVVISSPFEKAGVGFLRVTH